jgi:hypothetical protein
MYIAIKHVHSFIALLSLLLLVASVFYNSYGWVARKPFSKNNKLMALLGLIAVHTQFLIGLLLYFVSPLGFSNFSGEAMKNSVSRLYILEHPLVMIVALVLITVGYSKLKRPLTDAVKFKRVVTLYSLGLVLILSRIPWSMWL